MFFASGQVHLRYQTKQIEGVTGVLRLMPIGGGFLVVGALALAGAPPFGVFASELTILSAGFQAGQRGASLVILGCLVVLFIAFMRYINGMAFGAAPAGRPTGDANPLGLVAMACSLVVVVGLGIVMPA